MDKNFDQVQIKTPGHSTFNLSHDWKGSCKMGKLVPVFVQEALPSDRFTVSADMMARMMPMITPPMHQINIYFHGFFVPNRILWPNWEKFITGGQIGDVPPALPVFTPQLGVGTAASSLANYLGLPVVPFHAIDYSALPFAAYYRIWYDWYRDQNLQNVPEIQLLDGDNGTAFGGEQTELEILRNRPWEHDYFTSALPFVQKGDPVGMPVDFSGAEIVAISPTMTATGFNPVIRNSTGMTAVAGNSGTGAGVNPYLSTNASGSFTQADNGNTTSTGALYDPLGTLVVQGVVSSTINDLRAAEALQKWLEKNARGGSRYKESLLVHFGVRSSDGRLDRAEYLGGTKSTMGISEVLQTSSTDATTPQGNMAGHGISVNGGSIVNYQCEEHGWFMIIMSIRPKTAYYQGIPRWFLKRDRLDYYFSDFAHLGEQEVFNAELVETGDPVDDLATFGYLPRFAEYRSMHSRAVGQMATTLEGWHMGRKFPTASPVPLNDDFIMCDPTKRIFAVTDPAEDEIICHIMFKVFARRPLPMYGTPL